MQRLRADQIKGLNDDNSLLGDIRNILKKAETYDEPVATVADLPMEGNSDGDMRLVLQEDVYYSWDEPTRQWVIPQDPQVKLRLNEAEAGLGNRALINNTLYGRVGYDDLVRIVNYLFFKITQIQEELLVRADNGSITNQTVEVTDNGSITQPPENIIDMGGI